jgi:hypothetical protein
MCELRYRLGITLGWLLIGATEAGAEGWQRRVPDPVSFRELASGELAQRAVPLAQAQMLPDGAEGKLGGPLQGSQATRFNPQRVIVRFKSHDKVCALHVEAGREWEAVVALRRRKDVAFAELDTYQQRQFVPNDPVLSNQWHHAVIGSFAAWEHSRGEPFVRLAIVDTPFQMDHPDLAGHTDPGWDVVDDVPVTAHSGIQHSTMCAGMAAAGIDNLVGVAGAGNCRVLPINIGGAISEMYNAVHWAADHGVRVVCIPWTGANSDTLNEAAEHLRDTARGILLMPGVNGVGFLDYTNQPHIYCVSMTDAADNMRSRFGNHIDLSAPGFAIFSTTVGSDYGVDSGTSYSTPLVAGMAAVLLSINPILSGEEVMQLLESTAVDLGTPGWDQFFGWGRVNFAAASAAARATVPAITSITTSNGQARVSAELKPGVEYELWRTTGLEAPVWQQVSSAVTTTNGTRVTLIDPAPMQKSFYRMRFVAP